MFKGTSQASKLSEIVPKKKVYAVIPEKQDNFNTRFPVYKCFYFCLYMYIHIMIITVYSLVMPK